jgi:hypothetical protein
MAIGGVVVCTGVIGQQNFALGEGREFGKLVMPPASFVRRGYCHDNRRTEFYVYTKLGERYDTNGALCCMRMGSEQASAEPEQQCVAEAWHHECIVAVKTWV